MKRFTFRLQTLLDLKKRREEDLKRELARKHSLLLRAGRRGEEIREALSRFQASERTRRASAPTAQTLRASIAYRYRLQRDISDSDAEIARLRREADALLQSLTEAKKESRSLEILKEKKLSQWKQEYKREEQETIDDVSQKQFIRTKRGAAAAPGT